jgi:hypothetical protein
VRRRAVEGVEQLRRSRFPADLEQPRRKARLLLCQPAVVEVVVAGAVVEVVAAVVVGGVVEPAVVLGVVVL